LTSFLKYEARRRISAREAMRTAYFSSLGPAVQDLQDSKFIMLPIKGQCHEIVRE
jgi:hypothetical protein